MGRAFLDTVGGVKALHNRQLFSTLKNLPLRGHLRIAGKGLLAAPLGAGIGYLTGLGVEKGLSSGVLKVSSDSAYLVPTAAGGILGGSLAHLFPTPAAEALRQDAEKAVGETLKKELLQKALRENSVRMLGGIGAGALGGYLLSQLLGGN